VAAVELPSQRLARHEQSLRSVRQRLSDPEETAMVGRYEAAAPRRENGAADAGYTRDARDPGPKKRATRDSLHIPPSLDRR
jgi:hypothetical protein